MEVEKQIPWIDGIYKLNSLTSRVFVVTGENVKMQKIEDGKEGSIQYGEWKFGEYGDSHPDVYKTTGQKTNNVEIILWDGKWRSKGVVSENGKMITIWSSISNKVDFFKTGKNLRSSCNNTSDFD